MKEVIKYTIKKTTLGKILIAQSRKGICAIFIGEDTNTLIDNLKTQFKGAEFCEDVISLQESANKVIKRINEPELADPILLDVRGTEFQKKVWGFLQTIPIGATISYTDLARQLNCPQSVRAVASACAANALSLVIPCHRVVRKSGALAGYRWGIERKKKLLDLERSLKNRD